MSSANPGRLAASRTLMAVEEGAHAEDVLADLAPPQSRDRGLALMLVLGALRRQGALDALLQPFVRRGLRTLDPPVRAALRLGAWELQAGRSRAGAVVHQWVEVAKATGAAPASGLVNAVLRKCVDQPLSDDPMLDMPAWMARRFKGWDDWVRRCQEQPPINIVIRRDLADPILPHEDCTQLPNLAKDRVPPPSILRLPPRAGNVPDLPGFSEGHWFVMDPSAAVVADMVDQWAPPGSVMTACAAPGGKSFRLADAGRDVHAVDLVPARLALLSEGAKRLRLQIHTSAHDWLAGAHPDQGVHAGVLVDAPCTGLGVIRRHPEIRWRRRKSDVPAMALRQRQILENASAHVAPDGVLVYSVCSPLPEEGSGVVRGLDGWEIVDSWSSAPPAGDEDGFQAYVLRRT